MKIDKNIPAATILAVVLVIIGTLPAVAQGTAVTDDVYDLLPLEQSKDRYTASELYQQTPDSFQQHPEFGLKPYNCKLDSAFELIHKRTINTRTLVKKGSNGRYIYKQKVYGKFHYKDEDGWWRTIDPRLKPVSGKSGLFTSGQQPVPVAINLKDQYTSLQLISGFEFKFNRTALKATDAEGKEIHTQSSANTDDYLYGSNGVVNKEYWPGIDRQLYANRGNLKTNYVLLEQPAFLEEDGFLIIEDTLSLPSGYNLKHGKGYQTDQGDWQGELLLVNANEKLIAKINPLVIYDQKVKASDNSSFPAGYRLNKTSDGYRLQIKVSSNWLLDQKRSYPVTIDPMVKGADTFQQQTMGYAYDPFYDTPQGGLDNYCPYFMTVKVPGKSELVKTDAQFESQSFRGACPDNTDCEKEEQRFRLIQPCSTMVFLCNDVQFLAGRCTTETPFVTDDKMNCLDPQCPPHYVDFELRLYHGSCEIDGCDTECHRMFSGTWIMTVHARTLEGNISAKAPYCKGDTVELTANADWGVPPYNYYWLHNGDTSRTTYVTPTTDTTFICRIRDSCSLGGFDNFYTVYDTIHLQVRDNPDVDVSSTDAFCSQGQDGTLTAEGSGTGSPYYYEWNTNPAATTKDVDSVSVGTYTVTVTDRFGCDTEDSVEVGFVNLMEIEPLVDSISCHQEADGSITVEPTGTAPFTYNWSTGDTVPDLTQLGPGAYGITVTDDIECNAIDTIVLEDPDPIDLDAGMDHILIQGESIQLDPSISPNQPYNYVWTPGAGLSDSTIPNPTASPDSTTVYTVSASVVDYPDCQASDSLKIEVFRNEPLFIPTAFTPNGDGQNDIFAPKGEANVLTIQIYDRWGNLVYEGREGWDGTVNGRQQPMATYVYVVRYQSIKNGEVKVAKGNVTLIR